MSTTTRIIDALGHRHQQSKNGDTNAWVFARELSATTGFGSMFRGDDVHTFAEAGYPLSSMSSGSRIDAFAFHTWPSKNLWRIAYEIKVSRSDLLRELANPGKRGAALALSNEFYFVIPPDVKFLASELPEECGIIKWNPGSGLRISHRAPYRIVPDPPMLFVLSLLRNVQRHGQRSALQEGTR